MSDDRQMEQAFLSAIARSEASAQDVNASASNETTSGTEQSSCPSESCASLLFLPQAWGAQTSAPFLEHVWKAALQIAALLYVFLGVSLIADRLLSAIEVIASMERQVPVRLPSGRIVSISIPVWNQTVAHLTLISIATSAPEILVYKYSSAPQVWSL